MLPPRKSRLADCLAWVGGNRATSLAVVGMACAFITSCIGYPQVYRDQQGDLSPRKVVFENCDGGEEYTATISSGRAHELVVSNSAGVIFESSTAGGVGGSVKVASAEITTELKGAIEAEYGVSISTQKHESEGVEVPVPRWTVLTVTAQQMGNHYEGRIHLSPFKKYHYTFSDVSDAAAAIRTSTTWCTGYSTPTPTPTPTVTPTQTPSQTPTPPVKVHEVVLGPDGKFKPDFVEEPSYDQRKTGVTIRIDYPQPCELVIFSMGLSGATAGPYEEDTVLLQPGTSQQILLQPDSELYYCGCKNLRSATLTVSVPPKEGWVTGSASVDSRRGWQDTGIDVLEGDLIAITYRSGRWTLDRREDNPLPYVDSGGYSKDAHPIVYDEARGNQEATSACRIVEGGAPEAAMIAQVGNGPLVVVGKAMSFQSNASGRLRLAINEEHCGPDGAECFDHSCSSDNQGIVDVEITARRFDGEI